MRLVLDRADQNRVTARLGRGHPSERVGEAVAQPTPDRYPVLLIGHPASVRGAAGAVIPPSPVSPG